MTTERRCAGYSDMFLSTDPRDHQAAAAMCRECPAIAWCMKETMAALHSIYGIGVHGTWAGRLYSEGRRSTGKKSVGDCPQCGANDGQRCVSPMGVKLGSPHRARTYGLPKCAICDTEFKRTPSLIRYCSEECAKTATQKRKRVYDAKSKHQLDKSCVDCGALTGGTRCVRCTATRASRVSHGREVA